MDCSNYRRSMMADPHDPDRGLSEHRASCRDCSQYSDRLLQFEARLERALRVEVPAPAGATRTDSATAKSAEVVALRAERTTPAARATAYRKGWLAMAASVLLALVVAGALWVAAPGPSLAAAVVTHMAGEPDAWRVTDTAVSNSALQSVLRDSHLHLAAGADIVTYASRCEFRGQHVPHLVIQTASGPVTVMVLVHEQVTKPVQFDEQGYRGVILPAAGHGSLAVLTHGASTDIKTVENIAARVLDSIVWTG